MKALIRIDDVGKYDPARDRLIRDLCQAGMRVTCAVVPEWLDHDCVRYLRRLAGDFPGLVEVHQHGFRHENYGTAAHKYEFGESRTYQQQRKDISVGKLNLEQVFGPLFYPAFTPPYNSLDDTTMAALRDEGFHAYSSFPGEDPDGPIPSFSPGIDYFRWDPIRERPWAEIVVAWREDQGASLRGIILHPRLMTPESAGKVATNLPRLIPAEVTVTLRQLVEGFAS